MSKQYKTEMLVELGKEWGIFDYLPYCEVMELNDWDMIAILVSEEVEGEYQLDICMDQEYPEFLTHCGDGDYTIEISEWMVKILEIDNNA